MPVGVAVHRRSLERVGIDVHVHVPAPAIASAAAQHEADGTPTAQSLVVSPVRPARRRGDRKVWHVDNCHTNTTADVAAGIIERRTAMKFSL